MLNLSTPEGRKAELTFVLAICRASQPDSNQLVINLLSQPRAEPKLTIITPDSITTKTTTLATATLTL